ncbi:MAG: glycosyltransferase family 39 protein [Candidatus Brocadiaceae bacterium]
MKSVRGEDCFTSLAMTPKTRLLHRLFSLAHEQSRMVAAGNIYRIEIPEYQTTPVYFRYWVNILFFLCLLTRIFFTGRYLDCYDSIDFAFGLHDYDLSLLQPHFPGYPVYLFISRLFFPWFNNDVPSLGAPGVLFGSLTVYPLSLFVRRLFSERVALLTTILYVVNPLCWLQAERPTSDAMGLFFTITSAYFLYRVIDLMQGKDPSPAPPEKGKCRRTLSQNFYLFTGSLVLGLGLGVRLSYFPFIALWIYVLCYLAGKRMRYDSNVLLCGLMGLAGGVCLWFLPQIHYTGWRPFWRHSLSFTHGHFTDWGGSIVTLGGMDRITYLVKSLWVYGLGGWWYDCTPFMLIPSAIIIIFLLYGIKQLHLDCRWQILGLYGFPYILWVFLGQNVTNPRHILPVIPIILMIISHGLCKTYEEGNKKISLFFTLIFIVCTSCSSWRLILHYHNTVPAPLRIIQFIEKQFDKNSTRIYCGQEKRFFDYYAPLFDARAVRNASDLYFDLQSSLRKPRHILLALTQKDARQWKLTCQPIITFKENPYTDGTDEEVCLFTVR